MLLCSIQICNQFVWKLIDKYTILWLTIYSLSDFDIYKSLDTFLIWFILLYNMLWDYDNWYAYIFISIQRSIQVEIFNIDYHVFFLGSKIMLFHKILVVDRSPVCIVILHGYVIKSPLHVIHSIHIWFLGSLAYHNLCVRDDLVLGYCSHFRLRHKNRIWTLFSSVLLP